MHRPLDEAHLALNTVLARPELDQVVLGLGFKIHTLLAHTLPGRGRRRYSEQEKWNSEKGMVAQDECGKRYRDNINRLGLADGKGNEFE